MNLPDKTPIICVLAKLFDEAFCDPLKVLFCELTRLLGPNEIGLTCGVLRSVLASETVPPFLHRSGSNWLPRDACGKLGRRVLGYPAGSFLPRHALALLSFHQPCQDTLQSQNERDIRSSPFDSQRP